MLTSKRYILPTMILSMETVGYNHYVSLCIGNHISSYCLIKTG